MENRGKWAADRIEEWSIDDLIPFAQNARKHSAEQVEQLAASMERFGFTIPVLAAEDGTIIAGHGRVMAAQRLGYQTVPVMVARGWTDEQRRAYTLADNRLAENATWDDDLLRVELVWLREAGMDATFLGFSTHEIDTIFNGWEASQKKIDAVDSNAAGDGELYAHIKVKCLQSDKAGVIEALKDAMASSGYEGVEIE